MWEHKTRDGTDIYTLREPLEAIAQASFTISTDEPKIHTRLHFTRIDPVPAKLRAVINAGERYDLRLELFDPTQINMLVHKGILKLEGERRELRSRLTEYLDDRLHYDKIQEGIDRVQERIQQIHGICTEYEEKGYMEASVTRSGDPMKEKIGSHAPLVQEERRRLRPSIRLLAQNLPTDLGPPFRNTAHYQRLLERF